MFAAITFLTPLVGQDEIITGPAQRETVYGPLYYLYIFHYLFISVFSIIVIFLKLKRSGDKAEKYQLMYLVSGLVVGLGWGFCTNILFPVLKLFEMPQNYGPLAPILLVGFIARGIFKHGLFDIKIIATEIFSVLVLLFLFINIFSFQNYLQLIINVIIFVGMAFFSRLLIKSVSKEKEKLEQLKKLTKELQEVTQDLQFANQNIKSLSEIKSRFLNVVNHQLRTPASIVRGMASMLATGSISSEKREDFVKKLHLSSERLLIILDDILVAHGLVGGTDGLVKFLPCQLEKITEEQIDRARTLIKDKDLRVVLQKPKSPLPVVLADPQMVEKIISRLLDNAVLYTEQGEIKVIVGLIKEQEKEFVSISIEDTGVGLDEEDQGRLFKLFSRGERATSLHPNGSGLGLFVVKKFIEIHRGKITAQSRGRNKGSIFTLFLPVFQKLE